MRKIILLIGVLLGLSEIGNTQVATSRAKKVYPLDWHMLSFGGKDSVYGAEINKAYDFLKNKQPKKKIVVAIIDSGFDDQHEDLKDNLWVNKGEISGDGVDNDRNGYVDDVHGWNFLGTPEGEMVYKTLDAGARYFLKHKDRYEELRTKSRDALEEREFNMLENIFKKSELGQAYLGMHMSERLIEYIENFDRELKSKFPGQELDRKKFETLMTREEKDSLRIGAYLVCYFKWQDTTLRWENIHGRRFELRESAKKSYEKLSQSLNDERSLVGDNMENIRDSRYGNANLLGLEGEHGTHVAGIIGAKRQNGIGMDGIADNVELMFIRAIPKGDEYDKDVALAIRYAVDHGANIINMSFGKRVSVHADWVMEAMQYAEKKGILLVHAAGNSFENSDDCNFFPVKQLDGGKALTAFINVGASTPDGNPARMSNYGKKSVDVFAPGVDIYSTVPGDNYKKKGGTSMAAPVVSGIAAILMSYYPELSARQVKDILVRGAVICRGREVTIPQDPVLANPPEKALFSELCVGGGIISAFEAVRLATRMTDPFQREFAAGNRKPEFLKEYVGNLKANPENGNIEEVLDCYLMSLPLEQRYRDENLNDFIHYTTGVTARSLGDIIKNWEKITLTAEQRDAVVKMVQTNSMKVFANYYFQKKKKVPTPDYNSLIEALEDSGFPMPEKYLILFRAWELNKRKDVRGMMKEMLPVLGKLAQVKDIQEMSMRNYLLNELLEQTDIEQCRRLENEMNRLAEKDSVGSLGGFRGNVEGRRILLEWEMNN